MLQEDAKINMKLVHIPTHKNPTRDMLNIDEKPKFIQPVNLKLRQIRYS